jgi:hypothetical protein
MTPGIGEQKVLNTTLLDNRLIDGDEVVSITRQQLFIPLLPQKDFVVLISGKKFNYFWERRGNPFLILMIITGCVTSHFALILLST